MSSGCPGTDGSPDHQTNGAASQSADEHSTRSAASGLDRVMAIMA